jgi:hypothetical protein
MSFLTFEPTQANRDKLQDFLRGDLYSRERGANLIQPHILDKLLEKPLTRVGFLWSRIFHRSALSPFGYAGITQNSPRKVLKQLEAEGTFTHLDYCSVVQLPVAFLCYSITFSDWISTTRTLKNSYDSSLLIAEERETCEEDIDGRAFRSAPYSKRTLEQMLLRYGGLSWRKYCKRRFDPFRAREIDVIDEITPDEWLNLKQVYTLNSKGRNPNARSGTTT